MMYENKFNPNGSTNVESISLLFSSPLKYEESKTLIALNGDMALEVLLQFTY